MLVVRHAVFLAVDLAHLEGIRPGVLEHEVRERHVAVGVVRRGELNGLAVNLAREQEGEPPAGEGSAAQDLLCADHDVCGGGGVGVLEHGIGRVLGLRHEVALAVVSDRHADLDGSPVVLHAAARLDRHELADRVGVRARGRVLDRFEGDVAVGVVRRGEDGLPAGTHEGELELAGDEVAALEALARCDGSARARNVVGVDEGQVRSIEMPGGGHVGAIDELGAQVPGAVVGDLDVDVAGSAGVVGDAGQAAGLGDDVAEDAAAGPGGLGRGSGGNAGVSLGIGLQGRIVCNDLCAVHLAIVHREADRAAFRRPAGDCRHGSELLCGSLLDHRGVGQGRGLLLGQGRGVRLGLGHAIDLGIRLSVELLSIGVRHRREVRCAFGLGILAHDLGGFVSRALLARGAVVRHYRGI